MSNNTKRTVYLILIFILLLTNIVAGYFWLNSNKDSAKLIEEKSALQTEYQQVQEELSLQVASLQEMKGKNANLDSLLTIREAELLEQQDKITRLFKQKSFSDTELRKAKELISNLRLQNSNFTAKIDSLNNYADKLFEEKQGLETDLNSQKMVNAELTDKNKYLGEKVELGAILRANQLNMEAVFIKKNGDEKLTNRIKKAEKLKVCFETGKNLVRDPGETAMYLVLNTPKGQTLYNESVGSGTMVNVDGETLRYSKIAGFEYNGNNKKICIYWTQKLNEVGVYEAKVYQDGHLLGESSVELK